MPTTQVGAHTVYYDEYGKGQPLLLIPGLGNSRLGWFKQVKPLSDHYRVIALDNRDAGKSGYADGPYAIADMAADVAGLIKNLDLGPVFVMGWSMGGFITQELTLGYPELVAKLALVATAAGGDDHVAAAPEILALLPPVPGDDVTTRINRVYPNIAGPGYMDAHPDDLAQIVKNAQADPQAPEAYLRQFEAVLSWEGTGPRLDQISVPALVVHGDADPLVPYDNGQFLAANIKTAQLLTYPGVGHLPPIEAPEEFNRDVAEFFG
jgi:3-oxoadipate enol-lactonase